MTKRLLVFTYGVLSYAAFFFTFLYAVGFVGNMYMARSMDSVARVPFWQAFLIDFLLLGVFAVQHSVMARPAFKRVINRMIPEAAERSTYVLCSSLIFIAMYAFWEPIGGTVWNLANPALRQAVNLLLGFGFALVLVASFVINHFDLFGLRQVWLYLVGKPYTHLEFRTPLFYRYVRHPLYIGWLISFWATPTMTGAHLLFAVMTTAYILVAMRWEERDLIIAHGARYEDYRKRVPKLMPSLTPYQDKQEMASTKLGSVA